MSTSIYQQALIQRAKQPLFAGRLEQPTHQADGVNAACGDEVHVDLLVTGGIIKAARHSCRACTICIASADLLMEALIGQSIKAVDLLVTPEETGERIAIPLSPVRIKCSLLAGETVRQALAHPIT